MYYVYLIQSKKDKTLYTGSTSDLKRRLDEHNSSKVSYTQKHVPYKLIYYEAYLSEKDARLREGNLKKKGGQRDFLKENLKDSLNT